MSLELVGFRRVVVPSDRGDRQRQKILALLAVSQADGGVSLGELLVEAGAHIRKGTVIVIITPSLERDWVPLAGHLRARGTTIVACIVDSAAHAAATAETLGAAWIGRPAAGTTVASPSPTARDVWAIERALHEHEIETHVLTQGSDLGSQIVTAHRLAQVSVR